MRSAFLSLFLFACALLFIHGTASAQVTNLSINRSGTSFTMTSGDTLRWEYDVPVGAMVDAEIWYDVNANGTIDPDTDINFFTFQQSEGNVSDQINGPPDLDGVANGHVVFYQRVGIPAGKYVFKFTNNSSSMTAVGTVTALASPAHTISGHVTPPPGKSAANILLQLERKERFGPIFWDAFTDGSGNYTIQMDADTAGSPWGLRIQNNPYPSSVISPADTTLAIVGNPTGYNFVMHAAAAQVVGYLHDENGQKWIDADVQINRQSGMYVQRNARTNGAGFFQLGLLSSDLSVSSGWNLTSILNSGPTTTDYLQAFVNIPVINPGDSLVRNLTIYRTNTTIQGQVRFNGGSPGGSYWILAQSPDTAQAQVMSDAYSGDFTLPVTNKLSSYKVFAVNLPFNYTSPTLTVQPGATGVILNITTTGVSERDNSTPEEYSLKQNYPNPFNPSTVIEFDLKQASPVTLSVYNILGEKVMTVLDATMPAGRFKATVDGASLPSGVYLYRLTAGAFSATKRMTLLK